MDKNTMLINSATLNWQVPQTTQITKLTQKEIHNLNCPIRIKQINLYVKCLPTKKHSSTDKLYKIFKEKVIWILHKLLEEEGTLPNLFLQVSIILIPKADKDITREEHNRPIYLMNTITEILNNILPNQTQQHTKG